MIFWIHFYHYITQGMRIRDNILSNWLKRRRVLSNRKRSVYVNNKITFSNPNKKRIKNTFFNNFILRRINKVLIVVFVLVLCITSIFGSFWKISDFEISRSSAIDISDLYTFNSKESKGKHLLLFDSISLEHAIKDRFKQYKKVLVYKSFPNKLNILVDGFAAFAKIKFEDSSEYVINEAGIISVNTGVDAVYYTINYKDSDIDLTNLENVVIINPKDILFAEKVVAAVEKDYKLKIKDIDYYKDSRDFLIKTDSYDLILDTMKDYKMQLDKIDIVIETEKKNSKLNKGNTDIEYIDLRIDDRIFYK